MGAAAFASRPPEALSGEEHAKIVGASAAAKVLDLAAAITKAGWVVTRTTADVGAPPRPGRHDARLRLTIGAQ